jgi:hypothetical protein
MTKLPKPLDDVLSDLSKQRALLINALAGLSPEATLRSPGPDQWNAAQVVDHLLLAEGFTNDLTKMMSDRAGANDEATGFPADLTAFDPLPQPRGMEAPPPIRPQRELPARELVTALTAMGERTRASLEVLASLDPRRYKMEHPLFGELDLGQWWAIHPIHYEMHIAQAQAALNAS